MCFSAAISGWISPSRSLCETLRLVRRSSWGKSPAGRVPTRLFAERSSEYRFLQPDSVAGMPPESWLFDRSMAWTIVRPPTSRGIGPVNALLDRLRYICTVLMAAIAAPGIAPERRLCDRSSVRSCSDPPIPSGSVPFSLLFERSRRESDRRLETAAGIAPVNLFDARSRMVSCRSSKSSSGRTPLRRFCDRSSTCREDDMLEMLAGTRPANRFPPSIRPMRFVRLPISSGIVPDSAFRCSCSSMSSPSWPTRRFRAPVKLFFARSSVRRLPHSNRSSGMPPVSELLATERNTRPCSRPSPAGRWPVNSLTDMLALESNVQLAMLAGIGPERELVWMMSFSRFLSDPMSSGSRPDREL
uniref:Predicted protein n=1 Tax=Hordeum vulgare subsp. vulgare TaxID=112509 RepID=F2EHH2_HORVV|nr:predicted protein [Hordeum vulgare subsp. vulgare]